MKETFNGKVYDSREGEVIGSSKEWVSDGGTRLLRFKDGTFITDIFWDNPADWGEEEVLTIINIPEVFEFIYGLHDYRGSKDGCENQEAVLAKLPDFRIAGKDYPDLRILDHRELNKGYRIMLKDPAIIVGSYETLADAEGVVGAVQNTLDAVFSKWGPETFVTMQADLDHWRSILYPQKDDEPRGVEKDMSNPFTESMDAIIERLANCSHPDVYM